MINPRFPNLLHNWLTNRERSDMFTRDRMFGVVALAGVALAAPPFAQGAALPSDISAKTPVMTCKETGEVTWPEPGIADSPDTVNWKADIKFTDCKGTAVDEGSPTLKSVTESGTEKASCTGKTTAHVGKGTITWSDNTTSDVTIGEISESKSKGSGPGDFPFSIVSGHFKDHSAEVKDKVTDSGHPCPGESKATIEGTFALYGPSGS
ncbi:hypothetical protein ABZ942_22710 [Nocardia sp. NPDC046473]|uniref:hypothetical protein n=1 Tax=Nocardia sp. NPDC046473 TaxID=3155733 RepID=UPI0033E16BEC